jgi:hypothetical protein
MMLGGSLMMSVPFMAFNSAKDESSFEPTETSCDGSSGSSGATSADAEVDELFEQLATREPIVVAATPRPIVPTPMQPEQQQSITNATATKKRLVRAPFGGGFGATPTASWPAMRDHERLFYQPPPLQQSQSVSASASSQQQQFDMLSRDGPLLFGLRGRAPSTSTSTTSDMATDAAELTISTLVSAVDRWALDEQPSIDPRAILSEKVVGASTSSTSSSSSTPLPPQSSVTAKGVVSSLRTLVQSILFRLCNVGLMKLTSTLAAYVVTSLSKQQGAAA